MPASGSIRAGTTSAKTGDVGLALSDLLFALGFRSAARRKLQNKPDDDPPLLLRDFIRHALRERTPEP